MQKVRPLLVKQLSAVEVNNALLNLHKRVSDLETRLKKREAVITELRNRIAVVKTDG